MGAMTEINSKENQNMVKPKFVEAGKFTGEAK